MHLGQDNCMSNITKYTQYTLARNKKCNLGKFKFQCNKCKKKGFLMDVWMALRFSYSLGLPKNMQRFSVVNVTNTFVSKKCLSKHVKDYHAAQMLCMHASSVKILKVTVAKLKPF